MASGGGIILVVSLSVHEQTRKYLVASGGYITLFVK